MSTLICNLPQVHLWVRREYLRDLKDGHGEFVRGVLMAAKSLPGRAFYFETFLPDYAAVYDKLPISAFVSSPQKPKLDLPLDELQFWNCMSHGVTCIVKRLIAPMEWVVRTRNNGLIKGDYICTLDNYHSEIDYVDYCTSEIPAEHKGANLIALENGQFALYPNNRCRVYDTSLTPKDTLVPDFKCSTIYYRVEKSDQSTRLGDTDQYYY